MLSKIIEILRNQVRCIFFIVKTVTNLFPNLRDLKDQLSHLISNLSKVCFHAFRKPHPDKELTLLIYEANYLHVLQLEASNPASVFSFNVLSAIKEQIRHIIRIIVTLQPERQIFDFTEQHNAMIAQYFMLAYTGNRYLVSDTFISNTDTWLCFRFCPNTDEYDNANNWKKEVHSNCLVALRRITRVLPFSCKDKTILQWISATRFHGRWNLDGWNDHINHIIQPARDSVLDYYQVCMPKI